MKKIQEKLKECVERQSLKSLDRLSTALDTGVTAMAEEDVMKVPVEAGVGLVSNNPLDVKGEYIMPVSKKKSKRKHKLRSAEKKETEQKISKVKRRPRFFCQFWGYSIWSWTTTTRKELLGWIIQSFCPSLA